MRCYSRLGEPHLAFREYNACVENLARELDVEPTYETVKLYDAIRRRRSV